MFRDEMTADVDPPLAGELALLAFVLSLGINGLFLWRSGDEKLSFTLFHLMGGDEMSVDVGSATAGIRTLFAFVQFLLGVKSVDVNGQSGQVSEFPSTKTT